MKKLGLTFSIFLCTFQFAYADMDIAWDLLVKSKGRVDNYPVIVRHMVNQGLYFASVPYIKEFLVRTKGVNSKSVDEVIDKVVTQVGIKQFEVLPTSILSRSNAPMLRYILAKKYFRTGKYSQAFVALKNAIPKNHPSKPFALQLEASLYSITKKYGDAVASYKECIRESENFMDRAKNENRQRQLEINRDYCIVGIARTQFAAGEFDKANLNYLDLSKSSYIWPEILFEEAWNSFYQRDYNRALGKLVTYKAPVLDFIFNPEIEVLRALTYLELCLWDDTVNVVNDFYKKYSNEYNGVLKFLGTHKKDYKYYYLLAKSRRAGSVRGNNLLNKLLKSITKDPAYQELYDSFQNGREELEVVRNLSNSRFKKILSINLKEAMVLQRDLIGAYVRKQIRINMHQLKKAFEGMSYIKLEVLGRRKRQLYALDIDGGRSRGDIKNLQRTEKQYFWTFNGEFWADELGDYVFSLKSECK